MYDEVYYTSEIAERTLNIQNMKLGPLSLTYMGWREHCLDIQEGEGGASPNDPRDVFMTN